MQNINVFDYSETIFKRLLKGVFLNTAADGKQNSMTIAWGQLGYMCRQPVFTVLVRQSRYSKTLLDANPYFTISLPINGDFSKALGICGSTSGRDIDKFAVAGLTPIPAQSVNAPVIKGCGLHLECRVIDSNTQAPARFDKELAQRFYADNDWHTYYTGVIVAAYLE
ncbi:MAG: flavin reductase [Phascolarctobacterium sp.]|uniref:flavin reductase family protein n=1 Tax=Phascolarctobacterium sp. TaxID=2049039 RepID=UPI0026DC48F9|nr:flavin reductase [Phascolarctobacterium sp.]MDO4920653.1 flavin reductase [Phascolarctobacterium sp.]